MKMILHQKKPKNRIGKKKSVSFCDQVVLVATADEDENDSYTPNPILERVLRSAMNKPETAQVLREIRSLQEAELNRDVVSPVMKFQQHTLSLKDEADSTPATPFQDQLRSVNPITTISESSRPISSSTRPISNESVGLNHDISLQQNYPSVQNQQQQKISYSPQLQQQQIRYSQNGIAPYNQTLPTSSSSSSLQQNYPQTHTSHPRNQGIQIGQVQKPSSPYTVQMHNSYQQVPQTQTQSQSKNNYPAYYHVEQQYNQMNKQMTSQIQSQQNGQNSRISSVNSSPITVQQNNQQFGYPTNQSPNPYQQYASNQHTQNSTYSYQNGGQQNRLNQTLPQYQPPPNPANYQQQQQHQQQQQQQNNQQIQLQQYHQRTQQKIEPQNVLAPNQTYPNQLQNGQIQSNMKYPNYQQNNQQVHQNVKQQNGFVQITVPSAMQKSASTGTMPRSGPCHLCRKKQVAEPAMYCTDCDFYMSRFRPKN